MSVEKVRGVIAALLSCVVPLAGLSLPVAAAGLLLVAQVGSAEADIRPRGAWSASISYVLNDVVTFRGSVFRAVRESQGKVPGSTSPSTAADWQVFVGGLYPLGAWGSTITYNKNDLVLHQQQTWRALHTSLNKAPQANPSDWQLFAAKGAKGDKGAKGATGPRGPAGPNTTAKGSVSAPAINFSSSPDTGIFSPGGGKIALAANGGLFLHDIGQDNLALGLGALSLNTGSKNIAIGSAALGSNISGGSNTAMGLTALGSNSTGDSNTAVGNLAMQGNSSGDRNTALGDHALFSNETGFGNTAVGYQALRDNTSSDNTAVGGDALRANTDGGGNTALGSAALLSNTGGDQNTALGSQVLLNNSTGNSNTAVGFSALVNTTAGSNTAVGSQALFTNATGTGNVALGADAGVFPTAPSNSIFIGNQGLAGDTTSIKIGVNDTQTRTFIAGIEGRTTDVADAIPVLIASNGQLGTVSSSRRYKEDIQPMGAMSDMLARLRPVSFRYKKPYADGSKPLQYGLIAEEVAETFPYLAVFNAEGQPETVKYHELPAFLLEGFQEQQQLIAEQAEQLARQQATIDAQAERMAAMEGRLAAIEAMLDRPIIAASAAR